MSSILLACLPIEVRCQVLALAWAEDLWSLPQTLLLFCVFLYTGSAHLPMRDLAADVVSIVRIPMLEVCCTCVAICTFPIHVLYCSDGLHRAQDLAGRLLRTIQTPGRMQTSPAPSVSSSPLASAVEASAVFGWALRKESRNPESAWKL